jgi:membrane complex biogenesis BtpA family protein
MTSFQAAIRKSRLLLGVVHLAPLPGSPRHEGQAVREIASRAAQDARSLLDAGFDGYLLENFGDAPFYRERVPPHVVSILSRVATEVPRGNALVGVNVLRNDSSAALAVALACDLQMIRVNVHTGAMVTDQGIIQGQAAVTTRERRLLSPEVAILADVNVKHAVPLGSRFDLESAARDTAYRGLADALIVTGEATGLPASQEQILAVRGAVPDRPLLVGSGVRIGTVRELLRQADGVIVGTALKRDGDVENAVDPARAREFVAEARAG